MAVPPTGAVGPAHAHLRPQVCAREAASAAVHPVYLYGAPDFAHSAASAAPSPRSVPPGPASTPSTTTASKPSAWTSCGGCSTRSRTGGRRSPHSKWLCHHVRGAARPGDRATTRLDLSGPLLEGLAGKRSVGGHSRQEAAAPCRAVVPRGRRGAWARCARRRTPEAARRRGSA